MNTSSNNLSIKDGITMQYFPHEFMGVNFVKSLLSQQVDRRTVLFLSGGKTPKTLYKQLAEEGTITPGAVAMVDERYGPKFHPESNERMMSDTGILRYLSLSNIPFYPILQVEQKARMDLAQEYDETARYLITNFPKSIAILGLGADGHTAGIAGNRTNFQNPLFETSRKSLFVSDFDDHQGPFRQRITMTFLALSVVDQLIVIIFGKEKKEALKKLFADGSLEDLPGRFYTRPEIAKKTIFITDQKI